MMGGGTTRNM